jgi:hypothetical protein
MTWLKYLHKDHIAGAVMILVGLGAVYFARPLDLGTLMQMGPGYFPTALGVILILIGALIAIGAGRPMQSSVIEQFPGEQLDGQAVAARPEWRGWSCILGAFVAFIFLFQYAGAVPATTAISAISAFAERNNSWKSILCLVVFANTALLVVFWWALRMPLHLFWWN